MDNNVILNSLKTQLLISFSMLKKIIENCSDELWNKKVSGYVFWQQLVHAFAGTYGWLREEKLGYVPFSKFNGKYVYIDFENDPEINLKKDDIIKCCTETKDVVQKWFSEKDDNWFLSPWKIYPKITNLDNTVGQIRHLMYHVGHCEASLREKGIETGEWL